MRLTKLGNFISVSNYKNTDEVFDKTSVVGISTNKEIITTKANMENVSTTSYKVLLPKYFAYVPDTSRRGNKMSLCYNTTNQNFLVSSISIVFRVKKNAELLPDYLFMYFNRPEFDRYSRFNSWGSARETFSWDDMCDIDLDLPPLDIQQKYVDVYNAMLANQKAYEQGLEDLKLTCDAYIENLRNRINCTPIGDYIEELYIKNINKEIKLVQGVDSTGRFIPTKAKMSGIDISKYNVVDINDIAYNPSRINLGSIALCQKKCVVSPMYKVFRVTKKDRLIPEYLMMWLGRKETQRYTLFNAVGSVRDTFDYGLMCELKIPMPNIKIQQYIVNIYTVYQLRRELNDQLKAQVKELCPILIKGSLEEASKI